MSKFDNVLIQSKKIAEEKKEHHFQVIKERRIELLSNALIADRDFDGRRNKSLLTKAPDDYIDLSTASKMTGLHVNKLSYMINNGKLFGERFRVKHCNLTWHIRLIDAQKLADKQRGA